MTQQEHIVQEPSALRLKPIVSYPREAKIGERYLFTIDVQLAEDSPWPYQEEEFEISFILETSPFFMHEPVGGHEPGLVLHRYGGTYGTAEYLLTAAKKIVAPGKIKVTLLNGWGLPIAQVELDCEVKKDAQAAEKRTTRKVKTEQELPFSNVPTQQSMEERFNQSIEEEQLHNREQQELIARQLSMVGWDVKDAETLLQGATIARIIVPLGNIALRGYRFLRNDYMLIIDCKIVGFIEVNIGEKQLPEDVDSVTPLDVLTNTKRSNLKIIDFPVMPGQLQSDIPFIYHTTGYETTFSNYLEPVIYNENIYTFHKPSTLATWLDDVRSNASYLLPTLVKSVRRLLKKEAGLSGDTDRLPQLTWLLLLKYLDDLELTQEALLGNNYIPIIEPRYRWRDWVVADNPIQRRTGEELLVFVNNDLIPYLGRLNGENVRDIRTIVSMIFRGTYNRIRSGYILREVVDKLNTINFNSSDDTHMIALYYESMLKEMRDSAGDSGEFYTPRPIVRFIIDCLQPQLGENMLDPACGTAGFLVETYRRLVGQVRTTEQRQQLQDDLIGIEKKHMAYLLGVMNMLLHGIEVPNIIQSNALVTNIQQLQDEDYVDIIATNPPFGGNEEPDIVNNVPLFMYLYTSETTLLFVQYIMQALKRPGGRCGIVLPDSFLSDSGGASRIRQSLLINFNLHTIVRLPRGVFAPYTSIPTNILFFERSENQGNSATNPCTKEVWYYEIPLPEGQRSYTKTKPIQYEAFHDCLLWWEHREENEHAWKVSVEELFANDCNLDVKRGPIQGT